MSSRSPTRTRTPRAGLNPMSTTVRRPTTRSARTGRSPRGVSSPRRTAPRTASRASRNDSRRRALVAWGRAYDGGAGTGVPGGGAGARADRGGARVRGAHHRERTCLQTHGGPQGSYARRRSTTPALAPADQSSENQAGAGRQGLPRDDRRRNSREHPGFSPEVCREIVSRDVRSGARARNSLRGDVPLVLPSAVFRGRSDH